MKLLKTIFNSGAEKIVKEIGSAFDKNITSDDEKSTHKGLLIDKVVSILQTVHSEQSSVLQTEMKGNWLQKSWRPIMMLSFGMILVCKWFGLTAVINHELEMELMTIIKLGLSGYIGGRSLEKISENITKNSNISFLKKKDRKIIE